ncbi:MAG TPA: SHOCT domain-containing protein [Gammaproteobacteria bacterium]|nr:SHOCT domain-containing protein [Gammaproteobacteria bacterium]
MSYTKSGALAAVAALATAIPAWAQYGPGGGYSYGPGMMWGGGWGGSIFGMLMMLVYFGAIVLLVVFAIRWIAGLGSHRSTSSSRFSEDSALDILRERFARGEIDKAEFEERKRHLTG